MKQSKLLIILDGWGYSKNKEDNAINLAKTPTWDMLWQNYPHTLIKTSGHSVGLPNLQMGNSEVGHLNLGAGRIVKQDLMRINDDIKSGAFQNNKIFKETLTYAKNNNKAVHIMGLLSDGGVHSHEEHIFMMLKTTKHYNCEKVYLHIFTDGRDTPPKSAKTFIKNLENKISLYKIGKTASVIGRFYAMDRDNRWDRIDEAYQLIINAKAKYSAKSAQEAIDMAYKRGESDEFISATTIGEKITVNDGDVIIAMNFRADRIRQITEAITNKKFNKFANRNFVNSKYICLTEYNEKFNLPTAYGVEKLKNVLGEYLAKLGMKQLRIAETEKYAHVTFFFNGGVEKPFNNEDRVLIPSPKITTYDLKPEMSAFELTKRLIIEINSGKYDLIVCNFANADMVGHSGKLGATVKAIEAVDKCLGDIYEVVKNVAAEMLITADHGNAEQMLNYNTNLAHTAHTNNKVPLLFIGRKAKFTNQTSAKLSDIAPTILELMGINIPKEMTGCKLLTFDF